MRRGRLGSARYGGPYAAGPDETTAALLTGELKAGPGGGPVLRLIGRSGKSCSIGFAISEKVPRLGDARLAYLDHDPLCVLDVWAAETDRYAGVKGGSKNRPSSWSLRSDLRWRLNSNASTGHFRRTRELSSRVLMSASQAPP